MKTNENKLDLLRARKGLSRKELAEKAKIGTTTLRVSHKKDVDAVVIGKIAKALEVDPEEIILKEE